METLLDILSHPFSWGLLLGLGLVFFVWKSGAKDKKFLKIELYEEMGLTKHNI